jgi:N-acetylglucosamine-6-phosphate deacetylase
VPGFVDLQVNGGGGHLIGAGTTLEKLAVVCDTHLRFGVTSLLPTLITDTPEVTSTILTIGAETARRKLLGFMGLHLEGPHLAPARKGAHDPRLIRPMAEGDLVMLERARAELPCLLVTVATEACTPEQIARLVKAGIVVSLGHSDASYEAATAAIRAGARMATHLFNAMSQLGNREPGLVGAVLDSGEVAAGVIADGIHMHAATLATALRAKGDPGALFLVSDSMSQAGTTQTEFELDGRTFYRRDGALRLADGTLAGADLTLDAAVRNLVAQGHDLTVALRMASALPAAAIGSTTRGRLSPGGAADFVHLADDLALLSVWRGGRSAATP